MSTPHGTDPPPGPFFHAAAARGDCSKACIATHYVRASRLPALEARLASMEAATVRDIAAAIDEFSADEASTGMGALVDVPPFTLRKRQWPCFTNADVAMVIGGADRGLVQRRFR